MKTGLVLCDKGIKGLDMSQVKKGNPGMGGTEFLFLLLAYYLHEAGMEVTIYHFEENILPVHDELVADYKSAFKKGKENNEDIFIIKNTEELSIYEDFDKSGLKGIVWCHNFLSVPEMKLFNKLDSIKRVVMVGRQMYDYYLDEPLIKKIDYCFNMFIPNGMKRNEACPPNVTYIGSLCYQKHFHILAKYWKEIVKEVPDACLHVIGSGRLYDRNEKLGPLGIAGEDYENEFLPYLTDDNGKLLDSVIFHGLMGVEKFDILKETKVGVVNPMAATETFCLCAVEMESLGIPVVSRKKNGLLDTIRHEETGLLYTKEEELPSYVVRLLKDEELNKKLGANAEDFANKAFLPEEIMNKWVEILNEVYENKAPRFNKPKDYFFNNGKRIRLLICYLRRFPLFRHIPSIHDIQGK